MAQLEVTVKNVEQIWQSEDKARTLWKVTMAYGDKVVQAKTFSQAIANVGWQGTVESYQKDDRDGKPEAFVKQPQKPFGGGATRAPRDDSAIQAQWAIGRSIDWLVHQEKRSQDDIEPLAEYMFGMIERVKNPEVEKPDRLYDGDGPINLDNIPF